MRLEKEETIGKHALALILAGFLAAFITLIADLILGVLSG